MKWLEAIMLFFTIGAAYWFIELFTRWYADMINEEFEEHKNETKENHCVLCGVELDFEKTQRVINVNGLIKFCCLVHEQRDIVQYIKKNQEEKRHGI